MSDIQAVNDLKGALSYLKGHKWMRGVFLDISTGACCAIGAFGWPFPTESPGIPYLAAAARQFEGWKAPKDINDLAVIIRFNDSRGRKREQVEEIFVRAIALAESAVAQ